MIISSPTTTMSPAALRTTAQTLLIAYIVIEEDSDG